MFTKEKEDQLVELISEMGSQWTPRLYNTFAPKCAFTAIETVFLKRDNRGHVNVLLTKRPPNDAYYPNQWHSPGTMLRGADVPKETKTNPDVPKFDGYKEAFDRLVEGELKLQFRGEPKQVKSFLHFTPRGPENALIFLCELDGEPKVGRFFDIMELPPDLIEHHHRIIYTAVKAFEEGEIKI